MKIIIIGGGGFVGSYLTKKLIDIGCEVVITTRSTSSINNRKLGASYIEINYTDSEFVFSTFEREQPDYIVHLASGKDRRSLKEVPAHDLIHDFQVNLNIVQAAARLNGLKRFIFIGSSDQYDMSAFTSIYSPSNAYGFQKSTTSLLLDALFRESSFPVVKLVPTIIYGSSQGEEMFLPSLINTLKRGEAIEMTKGEQFRDFIHVNDLVNAILVSLFDLKEQFLGKTY
jgi:nucleoside-diphosphate-sugar epimerase